MDLTHFFTTTTVKTMCHDPKDWHMWETGIPRLAFQTEYLLEALFAMACLHRAALDPSEERFWQRCGIEYMNRGLAAFQKVFDAINEESCHAAFAL